MVRPNTKEIPEPVSNVAWGPTYQVLYPAVTVGRVVAPLASVANSTASWCHSSELYMHVSHTLVGPGYE